MRRHAQAALPGWCLVVVGDAITPDEAYEALARRAANVTYLSLAAQRELPFETVARTPERHFGRKNIGYLYVGRRAETNHSRMKLRSSVERRRQREGVRRASRRSYILGARQA